jgi:DNA-binding transcriptional LysR family regulator
VQWDDLRIFLAVAQTGSLRRAARALRLGQPTIGRRLRQLEDALGARLFERTPDGHGLTRWGQTLLPMAEKMAAIATAIDRRRLAFGDHAGGVVRMAAGEWAARFLAPRLPELVSAHRELTIELAETQVEPDLDRREVDLFIRHGLPAKGHLVRTGLGTMSAAVYGAPSVIEAHPAARTNARWRSCPWVAYDAPHEYFGSMRWLAERLGDLRPQVRASEFSLLLEAIRAGAGLGILPCFVGDADPGLERVTAPIDELAADLWLVVHPDLRAIPRIRLVMEWNQSLFKAHRRALLGLGLDLASRPRRAPNS